MRATWLPEAIRAESAPCTPYGAWSTIGGELAELRGVVVHHTASNPSSDPDGDLAYIWRSGPLVPEYNVFISRSGMAYVGCDGKSNNAGKGGNNGTSTAGRVPVDWCPPNGANSYVLGVVIALNGVGEPSPAVQTDTLIKTCAAISRHGVPVEHVISHWEWTKRKQDPAGPPRYAQGSAMWDMDMFRADVHAQLGAPTPTPPTPGGDDDMIILLRAADGDTNQQNAVFWWDGRQIGWVRSENQQNLGTITGVYSKFDQPPFRNLFVSEIQAMIDNGWAGGNVPPGFTQPTYTADTGVG